MLPDDRMSTLAVTRETTSQYSIRFANDDVEWSVVTGIGGVNIIGNITLHT